MQGIAHAVDPDAVDQFVGRSALDRRGQQLHLRARLCEQLGDALAVDLRAARAGMAQIAPVGEDDPCSCVAPKRFHVATAARRERKPTSSRIALGPSTNGFSDEPAASVQERAPR